MMAAASESRDFVGYGRQPPDPRWPSGARLALVIVLNVEEGAEPSIPDGDGATELALTDAIAGEVPAGTRDLVAESLWEYGSRVGFWRLYELFVERRIPVTINACAQALERNAEAAAAIGEAGLDLCCHGQRFARHVLMSEDTERAAIAAAFGSLTRCVGRATARLAKPLFRQRAHAAPCRRARWLSLRCRQLCGRPALLGRGRWPRTSCCAAHLYQQR